MNIVLTMIDEIIRQNQTRSMRQIMPIFGIRVVRKLRLLKSIQLAMVCVWLLIIACSSVVQTLPSKEEGKPMSNEELELGNEWIKDIGEYPPDSPPVAQIFSNDSVNGLIVAEGIPHFVSWDITQPRSKVTPDVKWPEPVALTSVRSLRFLTNIRASFVSIDSYDRLLLDENGVLSERQEVVAEYQCQLSEENPCDRLTPDGLVEYHKIPPEVLQHPYIVVYAVWDVPPSLKDGMLTFPEGALSDSVKAHWMFHLINK